MVDFMIIEISKAFFNFISLSKLHHVSPLAQSSCNAGDLDLIPGLRRSPGDGNRQPTPVFLSGKSHGQRSLVGCSPWRHKRVRHNLGTKQQTNYHSHRTLPKCKSDSAASLLKAYMWLSISSYSTSKLIFTALIFSGALLPSTPPPPTPRSGMQWNILSPTSTALYSLLSFLNPSITLLAVSPSQFLLVLGGLSLHITSSRKSSLIASGYWRCTWQASTAQ